MRLPASLLGCLLVLAPASAALAEGYYGEQKVVYHINQGGGPEDAAYLAALRNIRNHIDAVGPANIDVKVVMHGDGIGMVKDAVQNQKLQTVVTELKTQNVGFLVCRNTITGRKLDPDKDLFDVDSADIVPSGVAELSRLQQMGYTYIRP